MFAKFHVSRTDSMIGALSNLHSYGTIIPSLVIAFMRQTAQILPIFAILMATLAGCAYHKSEACIPALPGTATLTYPDVGGKIVPEVDYDAVPIEPAKNLTLEPCAYTSLTPAEIQCISATNSSVANVISLEGDLAISTSRKCFSSQEAESMRCRLMKYRSVDIRNQTAGIALRAFYQLALAEASIEPLEMGLSELEAAVVDVEKLQAAGFPTPVDPRELRQRRLELLSKRAELDANIRKLNEQISVAMAMNPCCGTSISPVIDWKINDETVDANIAVQQGLASRTDLGQVEMMLRNLTSKTLPAAQSTLQTAEIGIGQLDQRLRMLQMILPGPSEEIELPVRRSQLNRIVAEQQRIVAGEIRSAIADLDSSARRAAIARRTLELRLAQLQDIQDQLQVEEANAFQEVEAKLNVYQAQADLMKQIIDWKIADVQLREAQGLLAAECGFVVETECCRQL